MSTDPRRGVIGTTLDKYEVLQKLGEGGMATVYRGRHVTLNRDVAIKVLHPHLSASPRNRKRFAREARAIEHLRHENILEIFDYSGTDCSDCYIVTEFVEGETLATLLGRAGPLPSEVVALVGAALADALDYAHVSGILHRDLKPDNVMVRMDGTVKLMDFGIARFLDESQVTMTGALVGSPAFMSPEQAREGELDTRSDLFSLGTVLFHLVTGQLPFSGSNASLILKNIIEGNRVAVSELSPTMSASLADLIERLLQSDREERPRSAAAVAEELRQILGETGLPVTDRAWSLRAFLEDPEGYRRRLDVHLRACLLERGKAHLATGDHLSALRLFNRLLTIDDQNAEVLQLVQGLHADPEARPRRRWLVAAALGATLLAGLGLLAVIPRLLDDPTRDPTITTAAVAPAAVAASQAMAPSVGAPVSSTAAAPRPSGDPEEAGGAPGPSEPLQATTASVAPTRAGDEVEVEGRTSAAELPETPTTQPDRVRVVSHTPRIREPHPSLVATPRPPDARAAIGAPDVSPPEAPAEVELRVRQYWAEILEDGRVLGTTRDAEPIRLPAGRHSLVLRSQLMEDMTLTIEVGPGERFVQKDILLKPKPSLVRVSPDFEGECTAVRDGDDLGTLGALAHRIALPRPELDHVIVITCSERVYPRRISALSGPVIELPRVEASGTP